MIVYLMIYYCIDTKNKVFEEFVVKLENVQKIVFQKKNIKIF